MSHFYLPGNWQNNPVVAPESLRHHLRVRRIRPSETIGVFNGQGLVGLAEITAQSTDKQTILKINNIREDLGRESSYPLTLIQGLAANEKMDWIIEKAVELGVSCIIPIQTERSVVRIDLQDMKKTAKKIEHWSQIMIAACEQCDRTVLPIIQTPIFLPQFLKEYQANPAISGSNNSALPIVLSTTSGLKLISILKRAPGQGVALMIGPEGGFSPTEEALIEQFGWIGANMGQRILRTETAGICAIAAVHSVWGGF